MEQDGKAQDSGVIAILREVKQLTLPNGHTVQVRRIRNIENQRLVSASGLRSDDSATSMKYSELVVRCAVRSWDIPGLDVKFDEHPTLGSIARAELFDVLDDRDVAAIVQFARRPMSPAQLGN